MGTTYDVTVGPLGVAGGAYGVRDVVGASPTAVPTLKTNTGDRDFKLVSVAFHDLDAQKKGLELWFFDGAPAAIADNAAFTVSDADSPKVIYKVEVATADYDDMGAAGAYVNKLVSDEGVKIRCSGVPNVVLVAVEAVTFTAGLTLQITVDRD